MGIVIYIYGVIMTILLCLLFVFGNTIIKLAVVGYFTICGVYEIVSEWFIPPRKDVRIKKKAKDITTVSKENQR